MRFQIIENMKDQIVPITKEDISAVGEVLAQAFAEDPFIKVIFPDPEKRAHRIKYPFLFTAQMGVRYGEAYATSSNLEGIAIWMHFSKYKQKIIPLLRCAFSARVWRMGFKASRLGLPLERITEKLHKKYVKGEHWYLQTLGVDPTYHGKGYGTQLIEHMLPRIDAQNLPLYLETSTEYNVHFYKKFNFEVMEKVAVPDTDMFIWALLRPPQG